MNKIAEFINNSYENEISCSMSNNNTVNDKLLLRIRLTNGDFDDDDFNLLKVNIKKYFRY